MTTTPRSRGSRPDRRAGAPTPAFSTAPDEPSRGWIRFEQILRTIAYVVVFGVVLAALLGLTGLRTREVTVTNDDVVLTVTYAQVTRPGIATPFEIAIDSADGGPLPDELTVEVPSAYMAMFDENGLDPEPESVASDGTTETWTFAPNGEASLHIDFDARLQPNVHSGRTATVRVEGDGVDAVQARGRTWVLP